MVSVSLYCYRQDEHPGLVGGSFNALYYAAANPVI